MNGMRPIIVAALVLLMTGCSAIRLSYNQGPTLAYWWLDGYADFSHAQEPKVRAALEDWFTWHRGTQLPDYQQQLALARRLVVAETTPEQVCAQIEAWRPRAMLAYERALPAMAELVRGFSPAQIDHLDKRYARNLAEAEHDHLQSDPAERREANFKRTLDRAETLYGTLGEPQRKVLAEALAASPFDPQRWLAERQARQQDTVRALRQWQAAKADAPTVQAGLRRLAMEVQLSPRADYRAYAEQLNTANCQLVARLHNATSLSQRRKAAAKLQGWEDDVAALAAAQPLR